MSSFLYSFFNKIQHQARSISSSVDRKIYSHSYFTGTFAFSDSLLATRDGIFPLITNARIEATEVLKAYKNQPYLEKKNVHYQVHSQDRPCFPQKTKANRGHDFSLLYCTNDRQPDGT